MDCMRKKVNEEIKRGWIGSNCDCPYHPAHFTHQDCSWCYCPFFPCNDKTLGCEVETKHGPVWDCTDCLFIHRTEVCKFIYEEIDRLGIEDAGDPRFRGIFESAKKRFWKKGKALMIVGATSDAGKSVTVTALCRILHDKGYLVAPFKSQNMSLNSKVTMSGGEISMIQALQAKAAGLKNPDCHMNPILLKPKGDTISQVMVCGKPFKDYDAKTYYEEFVGDVGIRIVKENIDFLKDRYDFIIMEGAGSPAEINIYDKDIANMRAAEIADADVILVVNVEWGGSFAYAVGTIDLIPDCDRERIKGIILNNVRGDPEYFGSGIQELEELTGIPVLGIIPHADIDLPKEDSQSLISVSEQGCGGPVVGIVRFPRIANFTDLDPLLLENVTLRYVQSPSDLDDVSAVILPGTKNTVSDLQWMKDNGIADAVMSLRGKVPILGICGGYQMMGRTLDDSMGFENGKSGTYEGLGFFDNTTRFGEYEKCIRQDRGRLNIGDGGEFTGYELHMGMSVVGEKPLFKIEKLFGEPEQEGSVREDEMLFGTYMHGLFDKPSFRSLFVSLMTGKSSSTKPTEDYDESVEENIKKLARLYEDNLDMKRLMPLLGVYE